MTRCWPEKIISSNNWLKRCFKIQIRAHCNNGLTWEVVSGVLTTTVIGITPYSHQFINVESEEQHISPTIIFYCLLDQAVDTCTYVETTDSPTFLWNAGYPSSSLSGTSSCSCSVEVNCDTTIQITALDLRWVWPTLLWNAGYPSSSLSGTSSCSCSVEVSCDTTIQITALDLRWVWNVECWVPIILSVGDQQLFLFSGS